MRAGSRAHVHPGPAARAAMKLSSQCLLTLLLLPASANSATLRVPSEYATINQALDAANFGILCQLAAGQLGTSQMGAGQTCPLSCWPRGGR